MGEMTATIRRWGRRAGGVLVFVLAAAGSAVADEEEHDARLDVRDFGAVGDGTQDDGPAIARAIEAAADRSEPVTVVFPSGTYRIETVQRGEIPGEYANVVDGIDGSGLVTRTRAHVLLVRQRDLTLEGEPDATLVMASPYAHGIAMLGCEGVTVRGLTIEYDPLPFTQGRVLAVDRDAQALEVEIDEGYGPPTREDFSGDLQARRLTLFNPRTRAFELGMHPNYIEGVDRLGARRFRLSSRNPVDPAAADKRFVLTARRTSHAVRVHRSKDCTAEQITVHSAPGNGFNLRSASDTVIRDCVIEPKPGTDRLLATGADGVHCKFNRDGPRIEGCRFRGLDDDDVNVGTSYGRVCRQVDPRTLLVDVRPQYRRGDRVRMLNPDSGEVIGERTIRDLALVPWRDRQALRLTLDELIEVPATVESLDQPADVTSPVHGGWPEDGSPAVIIDLDTAGNGSVIRGNDFGGHRARAILIHGANQTIENNRIAHLGAPGILAGAGMMWMEGPLLENLVIRGNTFEHVHAPNILVHTQLTGRREARNCINRDVTIEANRFSNLTGPALGKPEGAPGVAIEARATRGLIVRGNVIELGTETTPRQALRVIDCCEPQVGDNTIVRASGQADPSSEKDERR